MKNASPVVSHIKIHKHICLELFWLDLCRFLSWFRPDHFFSLEEVLLRTCILARSNNLMLKCLNDGPFSYKHSFWLHTMLTDGLEWCGLLWCFYQLFGLSFWRHPFTAEDPLVSSWWNATNLQIWWRNKLIYILNSQRVLWVHSAYLHFCIAWTLSPQILITVKQKIFIFIYTSQICFLCCHSFIPILN